MRLWRIGDPAGEYAVWSGAGAARFPGRWNADGDAVIYAAQSFPLAMLEKLAHWNGELPPNQHFGMAGVPAGVGYGVFQPAATPDWASETAVSARAFGAAWLRAGRSLLLEVPSVLAQGEGMERNVLVNPAHPEAGRIVPGRETPVWWDERLLRR